MRPILSFSRNNFHRNGAVLNPVEYLSAQIRLQKRRAVQANEDMDIYPKHIAALIRLYTELDHAVCLLLGLLHDDGGGQVNHSSVECSVSIHVLHEAHVKAHDS